MNHHVRELYSEMWSCTKVTKKARILNPNIRFLDQKLRFQESVHVATLFIILYGVHLIVKIFIKKNNIKK